MRSHFASSLLLLVLVAAGTAVSAQQPECITLLTDEICITKNFPNCEATWNGVKCESCTICGDEEDAATAYTCELASIISSPTNECNLFCPNVQCGVGCQQCQIATDDIPDAIAAYEEKQAQLEAGLVPSAQDDETDPVVGFASDAGDSETAESNGDGTAPAGSDGDETTSTSVAGPDGDLEEDSQSGTAGSGSDVQISNDGSAKNNETGTIPVVIDNNTNNDATMEEENEGAGGEEGENAMGEDGENGSEGLQPESSAKEEEPGMYAATDAVDATGGDGAVPCNTTEEHGADSQSEETEGSATAVGIEENSGAGRWQSFVSIGLGGILVAMLA